MLKKTYETYKKTYKEYIIFIKCGSFYETLNDDAYILSSICNYKVTNSTNFMKCGFPISILNKVLKYIEYYKINYIIVDREIIQKQIFKENNYGEFYKQSKINISYEKRIKEIYNNLMNNIKCENIEFILEKIDEICKISC